MKEETLEGKTYYCKHTTNNPNGICDICLFPADTPTEPVIEDWVEKLWGILYDEYGDVGQNGNIKEFIDSVIRQTRLSLLEELEMEIESKKKPLELYNEGGEYESPSRCHCINGEGSCEDCVKYEFNQGLQVGVDIINKHKK